MTKKNSVTLLATFDFYKGEGKVFKSTGVLTGKEKIILQLVGQPKLEDGSFSQQVSVRQFVLGAESLEAIEVFILSDLETKSIGQIQTALIGYSDSSQGLDIPAKFDGVSKVG